jgi:glucose/arabinose dehydrogenase
MSLRAPLALANAVILAGCSAAGVSPSSSAPATSPSAEALVDLGWGLSGPTSTTASVYARGLANMSALAFDGHGRLWAATAAYSDDGADGVYLIESAGSTPAEVISDLETPLGLLWIGDDLYVSSATGVVAYSGFDGGAFSSSTRILELPEGAGEANGLARSPDGRLILGISSPCDHCTPTDASSASVVSFKTDGSDLEVVASGIRAPIGLAYVPGSNDLLVTMNQRDDLGQATPGDWLARVEAGQDWGFPECYGQGGAACSGVPEPLAVLDPHAAVSGLALLGDEGTTSAFIAEWALGRIVRVDLADTVDDATIEPFLTGLKNPVPVIATATGDLLVGDWGTGTIYLISGVRG